MDSIAVEIPAESTSDYDVVPGTVCLVDGSHHDILLLPLPSPDIKDPLVRASVGGTVSIAYIVYCYKDIDTQVVTTFTLIRNIVGFAITWGIRPWIESMGQQVAFIFAFILVGVLRFVITDVAGSFTAFGKALRRSTAKRYAGLAAEAASPSS